jgi:hypothetical protein
MFRSSTIVRELVLSLAKVMFKHLCPYRLCGDVAACRGGGVCVGSHSAQHTTHTPPPRHAATPQHNL